MINEENKKKTLEKFGYNIDQLSINSHKRISVTCDYCDDDYLASYKNRNSSYKKFPKDCCSKCKFKKREEVCMFTYGVKNSAQRQDVLDKISNTNFDKDFDKIKELANLGFSAYKISEKLNLPLSSLNRYAKKKEIKITKNNRKETTKTALIDKHGKDYIDILSKKLKDASQKLYGVDNYFKSNEIKNKAKETNLENFGVDHWMKNKENAVVAKQVEIESKINSGLIRLYDGLILSEICEKLGISKSHFISLYNKYGIEYFKDYSPNETSIEKVVREFLDSLGQSYEFNTKFLIYRPDFKVNDVIIECDGLYWHSDSIQKNNNYHINKQISYKSNKCRGLFFRSNEIENKFDIVSSIIVNALKLNKNKVYARNTEFVEINNKECFDFCEKYHLMGGFKSASRSFALSLDGSPISIFQIKQLKRDSGKYDLSRYCTIPNTSIIGGFSKLLKNFEKTCKPKHLQTFIDLRYGCGGYLTEFGFVEKSCFPSFQWTDGVETFHRMKFSGNSGYEKGLHKIWDCGQAKYEKIFSV
jgi:G:T-mismatch repair DNA endonuclease (very short patch repair protein)